jgi:multiple sugar transport system substrate-binding protein
MRQTHLWRRGTTGRRTLLGVAALTTAALTLAACSGGGSDTPSDAPSDGAPAGEPVTLSFLTHWGGDQVAALEATAAAFHEANPNITVEIESVPFGNLLTTLRTRGASPDGPTMAGIYDLWLPELVRDGIAAAAPAEYASDIEENWPAGAFQGATKEGSTYGYPTEMAVYGLNYNTTLFEQAGIDAPPTTWDEVLEDAAAITALGDGIQGVGLITVWNNGTIHPFLSWAASNGGSLLAEGSTTEPALDSPAVVETAEFYEQLVSEGLTDAQLSASNADTTGDYLQNFASGKTGMLVMSNALQGNLITTMGEEAFNESVAIAPIPVGPSGDKATGISYSWLNVVNAKAAPEKQEAAWKFLAFMNGPESGENGSSATGDVLMGIGILPSRLSDLEAHDATIQADPYRAGVADILVDATPFPTVVGGEAASRALAEQVEAIIFGAKPGAQAMEDAQAAVATALEQAQQ